MEYDEGFGGSVVVDLHMELSGQFLRLPYCWGLGLPSDAVRVRMVTVAKVKDRVPEAAEERRCTDKVKDCGIWRLYRMLDYRSFGVVYRFTLWFAVLMVIV